MKTRAMKRPTNGKLRNEREAWEYRVNSDRTDDLWEVTLDNWKESFWTTEED